MNAASEKASSQADAARTEAPAETQAAAARESPQQTPLWATRLAPAIQFALQVNAPRDPFEQEADRVAEAVMRAPDPAPPRVSRPADAGPFKANESDRAEVEEELRRAAGQVAPAVTPALQRQAEEDDESLSLLDGPAPPELAAPQQPQAKPDPAAALEDGDEAPLDPARPGRTPLTGRELQRQLQFAAADGRPLAGAERSFFEARFGRDFSRVRLHTGGDAAELATSLRARAFTLGHHIVFNRGQYNPSNHTSRRLLAHELTHVVQQGSAPRQTGPARQAPAAAAPARSGLQPTMLTRALPQRAMLQRAPEESKKFADIIDYKKAKKDNLESWYAQYKFFNLFKEDRIYPGSHPIAYANHVYQLQMKLQEAWGYEGSEPKWSPSEPGILEATVTADSTVVRLAVVAQGFKKDPTD